MATRNMKRAQGTISGTVVSGAVAFAWNTFFPDRPLPAEYAALLAGVVIYVANIAVSKLGGECE